MATVTEVKDFGIQAYVQALGDSRSTMGGQAYIRLKWGDFEPVGQAAWIST